MPGAHKDSLAFVGITMRYGYSDSDAALATLELAKKNSFSLGCAEKYWPDVKKNSWAVVGYNYIGQWIKHASKLREIGVEPVAIEENLLSMADSALSLDYRYLAFRYRWAVDNKRPDVKHWEHKILIQIDKMPEDFVKEYLPEFVK